MASHVVLKEQLLEMGFDDELIEGALSILKDNATLESVIEAIENGSAEQSMKNPAEPEDLEKNATPEELEARKKTIEDKIKQRRTEIEESEKEKERLREIQRRKDGKDMSKIRDELQRLQQENYVKTLQKEKIEAKAARDAILKQIEQDKADRKARFSTKTEDAKPQMPLTVSSLASKDGKTKLAIRMLDGSQMIQEFEAKEVLSSVRAYIVTQKNFNFNISLAMPPRPPFTEAEMEKSLYELGLVPNARLQVCKR